MEFLLKIKIFLLITFLVFGFFVFQKANAGSADNVSGWAWSENIGWISFNCNNPELPTPRCTNNYGVNIDSTTGVFSGDAWSENIGWISFKRSETGAPPTDDPCPDGSCIAKLDLSTNKVSGWAKALTDGGGWPGWIRLRDTNYGVSWNSYAGEMEGWAWSDQVIGWISFNRVNCDPDKDGFSNGIGVCPPAGTPISNYKVFYGVADVNPPTVSVVAVPVSVTTTWQNTDATATVSCTDSDTDCDPGSYKLKTYTSNPVTCSTNYGDYNLTSPQTISSHLWVCGTAKDLAGNPGFSSPVEFKVDKIAPSTDITNPAAGSWHNDDFTATIDDSDIGGSGLASSCQYLVVGLNPSAGPDCSSGTLSRSCDPVTKTVYVGSGACSSTNICIFQGENRCKVTSYAYDTAGNSKQTSRNFGIDWTPPTIGKIACAIPPTSCDPALAPCTLANQGQEKTFCASLTDSVGKITGCQLWVDGADTGVTPTISPIPCENGTSCTVSANYSFTVSGNHTMKFYCWDAAGNSAFGDPITVNVFPNNPPQITSGPSYATSPCTVPTTQPGCNVNFTVTATDPDGDALIYNWDFGDGGTSTEQNPSHPYSIANAYTVSVTVSDDRGGTDSGSLPITVSNPTLAVDLCAGLDANVACYYDSVVFSKPANGVDLKATVSGTMFGTINYEFGCGITGAEGWLSDWSYRKKITITGTHPADYQLKINLTYDSHMMSDFRDIRFTENETGPELPYWIESKTDGVFAIVWVKRSQASGADATIYLYYGNPSATSQSNPNIFLWPISLPSFTYQNPYGNTQFWGNPEYTTSSSDGQYGIMGFRDNWAGQGPYWSAWTWDFGSIYTGYKCQFWWRGTHGFYSTSYSPSGAWKWQNSTDGSTWSNLKRITFNPSGSGDTGYRVDEADCNFRYLKAIVDNEGSVSSITYTVDFSVDAIRVRKYASPEPTTSAGAEEVPTAGWNLKIDGSDINPYIASNLCNYSGSTYTAKVKVERGTSSDEDTIIINVIEDNAPTLSWTGESGYTSDGLEPETGNTSTNFVYRIKYTDLDGDSPNFVRVHIKKGGVDISGSPFNMSYVSGTYTGGAIYSFSKSGLSGGDYTYFFEAQDQKGVNATPTSEKTGPVLNNPPTAAISCDASGCQPGGQCFPDWIAYNRNCNFKVLNQSTDPDNNISTSIWSIFYQDWTPWQDPYLTCVDDPGTPENEAICNLTLPTLPASQDYHVKLYVEDIEGRSDEETHDFYVRLEAIAEFECSLKPSEGWESCDNFRVSEDVLVYFRGVNGILLSRPSEGASSITNFSWTLKDGTRSSSWCSPPIPSVSCPSASFKKVDANSGLVTLKITDNVGRTDTEDHQLLITTPLPEWREVPPL